MKFSSDSMRQLRPAAELLRDYEAYLGLERGLSENTLDGYMSDVAHLLQYLEGAAIALPEADTPDLAAFLAFLEEIGIRASSRARAVSAMRSFFRFLRMEGYMASDPTELLAAPRRDEALPDVLSVEEIDAMVASVDLSKPEGPRNRAILETLYGSGLRVSELCGLRLSRLNLDEEYAAVEGKGSKQRLVPLSPVAIEAIGEYLPQRNAQEAKRGSEDIVFLNRRGAALSRVMVFYIVRDLAALAGVRRKVSPHTLRHSFATHLLEGGANLRAIQEMLGHESIATTEIYLNLDRSHLRSELMAHHPHFAGSAKS